MQGQGLLTLFYQVVNGEVKEEDIKRIKVYADKVKKITSTNQTQDGNSPIIAPSAYLQLFQILGGPLSSVCEIRLSSSASVLPYISILLSSSLRSVDMDIISSNMSQNLQPFFNALPFKSPLLQSLILRGPDKLSNTSLGFVSTCANLRFLELSDVVEIKDWSLLQSIGTLSSLQELIVITHNLEYQNNVDILDASGFHGLRRLTITAPLPLIRDLVQFIGSSLQSVLITPVVDLVSLFTPRETSSVILSATPEPHPIAPTPSASSSSFRTCHCGHQNPRGRKRCLECSAVLRRPVNIINQAQVTPLVVTDLAVAVEVPNPDGWLTLLQQTFEVLARRWGESLKSFMLSLQDTSEPTLLPNASHIPEIPLRLIQLWAEFRNLQTLDIRFWKLASLDDAIIQLAISWPQLQAFCLPLEPRGNPMSLSSLRCFVLHCPDLSLIQAPINIAPDEMPILIAAGDDVLHLKHKLAFLSVGSMVTPQHPLIVARYINMLFPHLQMLDTHEGLNEQHWKQIFDFVNLCQSVREDDRKRFSV